MYQFCVELPCGFVGRDLSVLSSPEITFRIRQVSDPRIELSSCENGSPYPSRTESMINRLTAYIIATGEFILIAACSS
jgi:hypothetical protein